MISALEQLSVLETRHASVVFVASVNEEFGFSGAKAFIKLFRMNDSESNNEGSNNRLASMANKSVAETSPPNATVPPKLLIINTENPKNSTMEV